MSWMTKLYETYENCASEVGKKVSDGEMPLLPVGFSIQDAHVEIMLDLQGNFLDAKPLDKTEKLTMIPCTEDSVTRSGSGAIPHPLFDKLQYVAGDYAAYGGEKGNQFYSDFIQQLADWCASPYQNPKVRAIYLYLKKGCLIQDLVAAKVLWCDENGKLMKKWNGSKNEIPPIFKVVVSDQVNAFVRFSVIGDGNETKAWLDEGVRDCWQKYYLSTQKDIHLCYVTGKEVPCAEKHASKIRNTADMAKLISGNDSSGFTFRGRFTEKGEAVCVGYEVSQKAHNALRWLIDRQGYRSNDGQVILAWGTKNQKIPQPISEFDSFLNDGFDKEPVFTAQEYAVRLKHSVEGYKRDLGHAAQIAVLELNSATPGRLSIPYYRELDGEDYLNRIKRWYQSCCWWFTYAAKDKKSYITAVGTPAPKDIVLAAYSDKASDKLTQSTIERLLPCIVDCANIPSDLVNCAVHRASNPAAMEKWEWNKTLSVACAVYKKQYEEKNEKEHLEMALEEERSDRAYLYGRLLAIAERIESTTYDREEKRPTNAERMMNAFSQHPFTTWPILYKQVLPYEAKLEVGMRNYYKKLIGNISDMIAATDYENDKPLDGLYLLGYFCQRQAFFNKQKDVQNNAEENI